MSDLFRVELRCSVPVLSGFVNLVRHIRGTLYDPISSNTVAHHGGLYIAVLYNRMYAITKGPSPLQ